MEAQKLIIEFRAEFRELMGAISISEIMQNQKLIRAMEEMSSLLGKVS